MNIEFHTYFDRKTTDAMWEQGVNMDDWDYAIIAPAEVLSEEVYIDKDTEWEWFPYVKEEDRVFNKVPTGPNSYYTEFPTNKGEWVSRKVERKRYACIDYDLDRLLTGSCSNKWYLVNWNGTYKAIGVAYHA